MMGVKLFSCMFANGVKIMLDFCVYIYTCACVFMMCMHVCCVCVYIYVCVFSIALTILCP